MLYYDRIVLSEGMVVAKSNNSKECNDSKECIVCQYWFFNHGLTFKNSVCNGCHDLMMLCLNISDIAIVTVKCVDYCCIIHNISKSEATHLLENFLLEDHGYI